MHHNGPTSVYTLAKSAERYYSDLHTDLSRLEALGAIERNSGCTVLVSYDPVKNLLPLANVD